MRLRGHTVLIGLLVFVAAIVIGALHGPAPWRESALALFAWRRVLILPMALAVFDEEAAKLKAARVLLVVGVIGAVVSIVMAVFDIRITGRIADGVVYQNYATQGLFLSIGVSVALTALLRPQVVKDDRLLGNRIAMAIAFLVLVVDIIYVLEGRSGYLSVLVMSHAVIVLLIPGSWRVKTGAGAVLAVVLALLLVSSPVTRSRVTQAFDEIAAVDQGGVVTSLGQRVVFMRNTVRMIADHPLLGVGTGVALR